MQDVTRDMLGLYEVDRSIMDGKARLMRLQKKVTEQEKVVERARERAREIEGAIRDKAFATDALNLELRNAESEVVDQERRIKEIKNQREYRIISDRIKELKILADDRESAVISGMEELDRLRDAINQGHREIGEEELKLIQFRQETTEETEKIKVRHQELLLKRQAAGEAVDRLDPTAFKAYEYALRRTKGDPISEMSMDGICQSCFQRQNSNVMNIVHIGKDIKNCRCQGCGRILYIRAATDTAL